MTAKKSKRRNYRIEFSVIELILALGPIIGIMLGIYYVTQKDNLFSSDKETIELTRSEFKKAVNEILTEVDVRSFSDSNQSKSLNQSINKKFDDILKFTEEIKSEKSRNTREKINSNYLN